VIRKVWRGITFTKTPPKRCATIAILITGVILQITLESWRTVRGGDGRR